MDPLSCEQVRTSLDDLSRGEIQPADAKVAQAHLAGCAACRRLVEEMLWLDRGLDELAAHDAVEQLASRIHTALIAEIAEKETTSLRPLPARRASGSGPAVWWAAGVLALLGIAVGLWVQFRSENWHAPTPVARLESVQGEVQVITRAGKTPAHAGQELFAGQGLATVGEESQAVVKYADETRLDLGPETIIDQFGDEGTRKKVVMAQGVLNLDVVEQPENRPLVLISALAEVVVQGTRFSCSTAIDATRVAVEEGQVRFTRRSDGRSLEVKAGQSATAVALSEPPPVLDPFAPQPLPPALTTVRTTLRERSLTPAWFVAFSPRGNLLAVAGRKTVKVWDLETSTLRFQLPAHTSDVRCVVFSPDGATLATTGDDRTVRLWNMATGLERAVLRGHSGRVNAAAFSPDGKTLATGGGHWNEKGEVLLWDIATAERRVTLNGHERGVLAVCFAPDGLVLATGSHDQTVKFWNRAGEEQANLSGHRNGVTAIAFSPDGSLLASATGFHDRLVRIWDVSNRSVRTTLHGHLHTINGVAFSRDGKTLASGSNDRTVRLWDVATGREQATLQGHESAVTGVAFSPNGNTLATVTASDRVVKLWDIVSAEK